jgi:hypothetical protein
MKKQQKLELQKLSSDLRDLCAELKKARRQGKAEDKLKSIKERAEGLCFDLENYYQLYRPVFMPEVSAETVKDFFTLSELYCGYPTQKEVDTARATRAGR